MNVFEKAYAAADSIGIYSCPDVYPGDDRERWITYNTVSERGALYGDDAAHDMVTSIQVHLFLPANENYFDTRKQLRDALIAQGFTFPDMVNNSIEGMHRHIVFECEDDEERED